MSSTSTPVTERHFAYLAERTRGEEPLLADLKVAAAEAGIPPIWISPEQASFMQILLKGSGARRVLEVGTLAGYSAIAMARAIPPASEGGHLDTIEIHGERVEFARAWADKAGVGDRVEVHHGPGAEVLAGLETGTYDAAFLDADKSGYPVYLEHCLRLVRPGGLILVDNAFAFGQLFDETPTDGEVGAVRAFNDRMATIRGLHGVIIPIGDGLWVSVVESEEAPAGSQAS